MLPFEEPEPTEEWRPVVGYEGLYEVSSFGRVRSLRRPPGRPGNPGGKILRLIPMGHHGHYRLAVGLSRDGKRKCGPVHRLVAAAFLGPCPEGLQVRHGPGGAYDNRPANLSYGTSLQNNLDKHRDGTMIRGEAHHKAKLTDAKVVEIRQRTAAGVRSGLLAKEYGVSGRLIRLVVNRKIWTHVA